jgi:hypothetical protein
VNPDAYGGLIMTCRSLFDVALGTVVFSGNGNRELVHSILTIITAFFANVLLLNYLIAILSTTYNNMRETGIFKYKCNLFYYCERYMTAFSDKAYGEMVLHPPPLSYLTIIMFFFLPFENVMIKMSNFFSYLMFWIENSVFFLCFVFMEIFMLPLAYIKVWFNLIKNSVGLLKTIVNCIIFAIVGVPVMIFVVFRDFYYIFKIFTMH